MRRCRRPRTTRHAAVRHDRRSAVALMFAIMAIPIIGLVGLGVDYGIWSENNAAFTLAANAAALNAAKTAANADINNDPNYVAEGVTSGKQWFLAELDPGTFGGIANVSAPSVQVTASTTNTSVTATVTYTSSVASVFGWTFGTPAYPITVSAAATIATAPYVEIQILLDNSSSMQIAATPMDVAAMLLMSPCSGTNTVSYDGFVYSNGGYTYTPPSQTGWWPIVVPGSPAVTLVPTGNSTGPSCNGATNAVQNGTAHSPCAFACHSDSSKLAGSGNDLYALARSTIGKTPCSSSGAKLGNCAIQLRFDVVKAAVNIVIAQMQADTTAVKNLSVGIWDFNTQLNRDYPATGEAGTDFTAAAAAVGGPPTTANGADTGIQPDPFVSSGSHSDTYFSASATSLSNQLTSAGDGSNAAAPLKSLFLVTDGVSNFGNLTVGPFDTGECQLFKQMGFTIYVVYTAYYSSPHLSYFQYAAPIVEPAGSSSVSTALQNCASSSSDYISASDSTSLNKALLTFLKSALTAPARYTQ